MKTIVCVEASLVGSWPPVSLDLHIPVVLGKPESFEMLDLHLGTWISPLKFKMLAVFFQSEHAKGMQK